jgi:hypothetical protein
MEREGRRRGGGKRKSVEHEDEKEVEEDKAVRVGRAEGEGGQVVKVR